MATNNGSVSTQIDMIPVAEPNIGEEELRNVVEAVQSGWISSRGKFIGLFEQTFALYHGMLHGVSVHNGTCALHLAMTALGIGAGDEVLVPSFTFVASANTIRFCGATPVFVDVHPDNWQMDPRKLESAITPRTKAIMPVHLYGHACDMDAIMEIARRHKLYVIEDNAEGLGTFYKGRRTGTFGDVSCFSFYGNKIITTGEGGMCLTQNDEIAKRMATLRDHGMSLEKRYWHDVIGFNYRMTNIQAAIGLAQMKKLDGFLAKRKLVASWYDEELRPLAEAGIIGLQPVMEWSNLNYWLYSVLLPRGGDYRAKLMDDLRRRGIDTRPFFYPVHTFPAYNRGQKLLVTEAISATGINLPMSVTLTREQVKFISGAFKEVLGIVAPAVEKISKPVEEEVRLWA